MNHAEGKRIHDALLAAKPKGVEHESAACKFCGDSTNTTEVAADVSAAPVDRKEGNSMDPIYTQEQADSLVEAAVAKALQTAETERASALATVTVELDTIKGELATLQAARDADQMELTAAKEEVSSLQAEITKRDEEVAQAARKDERLAKVSEVANFSEKYITENTQRWVEMSEENFASLLDAYKDMAAQVQPVAPEATSTEVPEETAMANEQVPAVSSSAKTALFNYTLKGGAI